MNEQRTSGSEGEPADQPADATPSADKKPDASTTRIDRSTVAAAAGSAPDLSKGSLPSATAPADRPTDATTTSGRVDKPATVESAAPADDPPADQASAGKVVLDKAPADQPAAGSGDVPADSSTTRIDRATAAAAVAGSPAASDAGSADQPVEASTSRIPWPAGAETRAGSSGAVNANPGANPNANPNANPGGNPNANPNAAPAGPNQNAGPGPAQGFPYPAAASPYQAPGTPAYAPGAPVYGPGANQPPPPYGPGAPHQGPGEVTSNQAAYGAPPQGPASYPGPAPYGAAVPPPYGPPPGAPGPYGPPGPGGPGQPPYGGQTAAAPVWPPPGGQPWPGQPPPPRRRRTPIIVAAAVVVALLVAVGVYFLIPPGAGKAVTTAAGEVRGWSGVTYHGDVRGPGGQPVTVDVTVSPNGDKVGTLSRPGGGKADFAELAGVQVLRGDSQWWNGQPQAAEKTKRLAGLWLKSPSPETSWLGPLPLLAPTALADDLVGPPGAPPAYTDAGDLTVDGQDGRVVEWPAHRVVLTDGLTPHPLSIVPGGSVDPAGLRISAAGPDRLGAVDSTRSAAANAEDYTATLYAPTGVKVELPPAPPCTTPTCVTTVNLTNTADIEARGFVTIKENGVVIGKTPFRIAANGRQTVTATSQNQAYVTGMDTTVNLEASVSST